LPGKLHMGEHPFRIHHYGLFYPSPRQVFVVLAFIYSLGCGCGHDQSDSTELHSSC
jgi:hypothetical protein